MVANFEGKNFMGIHIRTDPNGGMHYLLVDGHGVAVIFEFLFFVFLKYLLLVHHRSAPHDHSNSTAKLPTILMVA